MSVLHIKASLERLIKHYTKNPDKARGPGTPVRAVMEEELRCRVELLDGTEIVTTDAPTGIGGRGSAPSPGQLFRASLASCVASLLMVRAAYIGIRITSLEVNVEGDPDDISTLGLLAIDDSIPAGERSLRIRYRVGAEDVAPELLNELVEWVVAHSPVGDSVSRAVPTVNEIEFV